MRTRLRSNAWLRTAAGVFCMLLLIPLVLLTVVCLVCPAGSILSLATHFVAFYFPAALLTVVLATVWWRRWAILCALLVAGIQGALLLPYVPLSGKAHAAGPRDVRVMVCNVGIYTRNKLGFVPEVRRQAPDLLFIVELNRKWQRVSAKLAAEYPYRIEVPREDGMGMALFSRLPLRAFEQDFLMDGRSPVVRAQCQVGETWVDLLGVHPFAPVNPKCIALNAGQIDDIARHVAPVDGPFLLAGDLNNSMWAPACRDLLESTNLRDTRKGHGVFGTYPARAWPVCVPIDHVLVNEYWTVIDCRQGNSFGSDHFPIIVDLELTEEGAAA